MHGLHREVVIPFPFQFLQFAALSGPLFGDVFDGLWISASLRNGQLYRPDENSLKIDVATDGVGAGAERSRRSCSFVASVQARGRKIVAKTELEALERGGVERTAGFVQDASNSGWPDPVRMRQ